MQGSLNKHSCKINFLLKDQQNYMQAKMRSAKVMAAVLLKCVCDHGRIIKEQKRRREIKEKLKRGVILFLESKCRRQIWVNEERVMYLFTKIFQFTSAEGGWLLVWLMLNLWYSKPVQTKCINHTQWLLFWAVILYNLYQPLLTWGCFRVYMLLWP